MTNLLREVLNENSKAIQGSQPTRGRNYNEVNFYDAIPPEDLLNWIYLLEEEKKKKSTVKPKKQKITKYDESSEEEHQIGESALMGEIKGAISEEKTKESTKKSTKKKGKATQSGKTQKSVRVK